MAEVRHKTVFDTDVQHLGVVYAKALLGATEKSGSSEAVLAELESLVHDVLDNMPQLESLLASPRVAYDRKAQILDQAFQGKMSTELLNFLKVVARRGRFRCLRAIQQASRTLYNDLRGRVEVLVRAAEPLDASTLELIGSRLSGILEREVDLKMAVDPRVVAGLVIRVGDTVYDGSVANQLKRLRDDLVARTNHKIRLELERFAASD